MTPGRAHPAAVLLGALALACGGGSDGAQVAPVPVSIRGGVVVEPPELAIGERAIVEVAVVTPPHHRLLPLEAPESIEGLWVLGVEPLPPERSAGRWVHRVRFWVRTRTTGELAWPELTAWVGGPNGERIEVPLAGRPLRVIEVSREMPERTEPFSFRTRDEPERRGGFLLPALLGSAMTAVALLLAGVVRHARAARTAGEESAAAELGSKPELRAREAFAAAAEAIERDGVAAAGAASAALRIYVHQRTGAPAPFSTTEELDALAPPLLLAHRWSDLVALLRRLDAARFRAGALASADGRQDLLAAIRAARALVEGDAAPREAP